MTKPCYKVVIKFPKMRIALVVLSPSWDCPSQDGFLWVI